MTVFRRLRAHAAPVLAAPVLAAPVWAALLAVLASPRAARADLAEDQVLVIYDSRVQDSRAVAEFYVGSAKVPGGAGNLPGLHPGARALDISTLSATGGGAAGVIPCGSPPCPATPDVSYGDFGARFRDPIRNYLVAQGLQRRVRCLVLTKGLPHRVHDSDSFGIGDNTSGAATETNNGDATYCALESELSLLLINLNAGEAGGAGDSKADGMIINPYWKATTGFGAWRTFYNQSTKSITNNVGVGIIWKGATGTSSAALNPGDMYLVARLDGNSLADVQNALMRAQNIVLDEDTSAIILDESGSDGIVSPISDTDTEFDNDGPAAINNGDDYEQTRDALIADRRWLPANIRYDPASGPANFLVGPLVSFGGGIVVNNNIAHLASLGANHAGGAPGAAASQYAQSFNYQNGATFNTIESFNARAFGGQGTLAGQEQASDFIASGGTLAVGNVFEPFSLSVPDNLLFVQNFWLGNMTFIEAAYSSFPVISWQQIAIGDPLAKVRRKREDINADGRVDTDDLYAWNEVPSPPDLNRDGTVNAADYAILEKSVRAFENAALNQTTIGKQMD